MIHRIDHIGILVRSLAEALPLYTEGLGLRAEAPVELPEQHVRVQFVQVGDDRIELLEPTSSDSRLAQVLAKRGEGLLHVCLEVDDIEAMLAALKARGVRLIDESPTTLPGRKMAFIHPRSTGGVLVELYEVISS